MGISCKSHFIYSKQKMFQFDLNKFETLRAVAIPVEREES